MTYSNPFLDSPVNPSKVEDLRAYSFYGDQMPDPAPNTYPSTGLAPTPDSDPIGRHRPDPGTREQLVSDSNNDAYSSYPRRATSDSLAYDSHPVVSRSPFDPKRATFRQADSRFGLVNPFSARTSVSAKIMQKLDSEPIPPVLSQGRGLLEHALDPGQLIHKYSDSFTGRANPITDPPANYVPGRDDPRRVALEPSDLPQIPRQTLDSGALSNRDIMARARTIMRVDPLWSQATWACMDDLLSAEECAGIQQLLVKPPESARVGGQADSPEGRVDSEVRRSAVSFIPNHESSAWLYRRIWSAVSEANEHFFHLDLGYMEPMQYTIYRGEEQGVYTAHYDWGNSGEGMRKLSWTLQLSDPASYRGGDLVLHAGKTEPFSAPRTQGTITVFPSWLLHEVTPVSQGVRRSLVGWCSGPTHL